MADPRLVVVEEGMGMFLKTEAGVVAEQAVSRLGQQAAELLGTKGSAQTMKALLSGQSTEGLMAEETIGDGAVGTAFRSIFDQPQLFDSSKTGQVGFLQLEKMSDQGGKYLYAHINDGPLKGASALWKPGDRFMTVESPNGFTSDINRHAFDVPPKFYNVDGQVGVEFHSPWKIAKKTR